MTLMEQWCNKKSNIIARNRRELRFYEREIWWVSIGLNIGNEQNGSGDEYARPVVVLKKFNANTALIVPLTTHGNNSKYYFDVGVVANKRAKANISQLRLVDTKRFLDKIGMLDKKVFRKLNMYIVEINFPCTRQGEAEADK